MQPARYASALPRATCLLYACEFAEAEKVLALDGVRRALIAYWTEALIGLRERGYLSLFARYHNYNAVARIVDGIRREERFFRRGWRRNNTGELALPTLSRRRSWFRIRGCNFGSRGTPE